MNKSYYDLFQTVIKNKDEMKRKKNVIFFLYDNFIMPNSDMGIKPRETKLR